MTTLFLQFTYKTLRVHGSRLASRPSCDQPLCRLLAVFQIAPEQDTLEQDSLSRAARAGVQKRACVKKKTLCLLEAHESLRHACLEGLRRVCRVLPRALLRVPRIRSMCGALLTGMFSTAPPLLPRTWACPLAPCATPRRTHTCESPRTSSVRDKAAAGGS